ncbi:MAG TPA: hypothetical protein DER09_01495 [Prolixibacteraceae bacterium]|nr:hypothetical protein [Prolixibacteraceae bacterium]
MFGLNTDKAFDTNKTNQYRLSIQVSLDGFSFLVFSEVDKKVLASKNTAVKISSPKLVSRHFSDWVNAEPVLKLPYQKVTILIFEEHFTLIPNTKNSELSTELLTNPDRDRFLFQNQIESIDASLQFGVNNELTETVKSLYGNAEWTHPVSLLLDNCPDIEKPNTGVLLQSQNQYFLILKRKSQLLLANCFRAEHSSDLVYFLLNSFRQLGISRNLTHLLVAGTRENNRHLIELALPYFPTVSELHTDYGHLDLAAGINRLHFYLTLNKN